jgi:hypothetical protein
MNREVRDRREGAAIEIGFLTLGYLEDKADNRGDAQGLAKVKRRYQAGLRRCAKKRGYESVVAMRADVDLLVAEINARNAEAAR